MDLVDDLLDHFRRRALPDGNVDIARVEVVVDPKERL